MTVPTWRARATHAALGVAACVLLASSPARAQDPGSTGVDGSWLVSWSSATFGSSSSGFFTAFLIASPPGVWEPNTGAYAWIGADRSASLSPRTGSGEPNYLYTFRNLFNVSALDAPSYSIVFRCAIDNALVSYTLNGVTRGTDCGTGFRFGSSQVLLGGFVPGENTLDFLVTGDGTTDGLLVSVDQVTVTPEPATFGLMAIGLAGAFAIARRRRTVTSAD